MLQTVQQRQAAVKAMAIAVKEREGSNTVDVTKLRAAMADAMRSCVTPEECTACEAVLQVEEQKQAAVDALQRAMEYRAEEVLSKFGACGAHSQECIKELQTEIQYCRKVNVPESLLVGPGSASEAVEEEETKCQARAKLHDND